MPDFGVGEAAAAATAASVAADTAATAGTAAAVGATATAAADVASVAAATELATSAAAGGAAAASAAPSLLSYAGLASTALSGGVSALGAINSASANKASAEYQAQVAKNNQALSSYQAQQAGAAEAANETKAGLRDRAAIGQIETAQAANNLDVNSGSAVNVRDSQSALNDLDMLTLRHDAAQRIYGYQVGAGASGSEAVLDQSRAASAGTAGGLTAAGSLLSSAGQGINQYYSWMKNAGNSGKQASWMGS